jgi:hypothetical protein
MQWLPKNGEANEQLRAATQMGLSAATEISGHEMLMSTAFAKRIRRQLQFTRRFEGIGSIARALVDDIF